MKEMFEQILSNYRSASLVDQANHPLANHLRNGLPDLLKTVIPNKERYIVKGSAGVGNWSKTPWVAVFDILVTTTAQSGYYPVFLFRDDMSGFYLSLNQGVTDIKDKYKKDASTILILKAEDFRAQLDYSSNFNIMEIKLRLLPDTNPKLTRLYEAGNIIAKYYPVEQLPNDLELMEDLNFILKIYDFLIKNESKNQAPGNEGEDESFFKGTEDLQKFRFHKRIERNGMLAKKVKAIQGYTCKACSLNFEEKYGALGKDFIEAHHMKPLSEYNDEKIQLDVRKDFIVLCSNCHSMTHRLDDTSNLEDLKKRIQQFDNGYLQ